ncbi:MAG: inositol monophosphatase family protein [bacterium]
MDSVKIKKLALELALRAGEIQKSKFRTRLSISWKGATDPVTEVDRACEALIVKGIRRAFPDHAIVGEEGGAQGRDAANAPFTWFIDPLDGTVNYSHGLPQFAVSIGVWQRGLKTPKTRLQDSVFGAPVVGLVHAPLLKETYSAERGKGAFLNGQRLVVSTQAKPMQAVLASGFSYTSHATGENTREWMEVLRRFQAIRRMGSAALDLCFTAAGRFDAFWEYGLKSWDVAAAGLALEEAGGTITNIAGSPYVLGKPGIVASNRRLHKPLLACLKRALARPLRWTV